MPIYGYRCQACGDEFEVTQRMSDPAEAACPACGGAGTRLFFPAGILFKGTGFYKTDSRSSSTTAAPAGSGKSADGATTPGKAADSGSTPSKPATESTPSPASGGPAATKPSPAATSSD